MSRQINQPINQVRLTNVAVVRMNKGGKRFEIACYRNKVVDYRQGLEQDLSEVLQTERIFTNVSKGEFSKAKDLQKVFGTKDEEEIAKLILHKGSVQISDKERTAQLEKTTAQIAEWIAKNCVHPTSERPYTISQIRHAMQQGNFSVHPTKPIKRQYLDCVKLLQDIIPIQRAKMELLLLVPTSGGDGDGDESEKIESVLKDNNIIWNREEEEEEEGRTTTSTNENQQYRVLVDPSLYRVLNEVIQTITGSRIEIVTQIVTKQGDVNLETELIVTDETTLLEGLSISKQNTGSGDVLDDNSDNDSDGEDNNKSKNNRDNNYNNDDDEDDEEEDLMVNRRKQQKKAKKKNQKAKRRGDGGDMGPSKNRTDETFQNTNATTTPALTPTPQSSQPNSSSSTLTDRNSSNGSSTDTRKSCNTCGGFFDTAAAYRSHFKSDWHRFNQKLKLKGVPPVSEQEFSLCDSDTFFGSESDLM